MLVNAFSAVFLNGVPPITYVLQEIVCFYVSLQLTDISKEKNDKYILAEM